MVCGELSERSSLSKDGETSLGVSVGCIMTALGPPCLSDHRYGSSEGYGSNFWCVGLGGWFVVDQDCMDGERW